MRYRTRRELQPRPALENRDAQARNSSSATDDVCSGGEIFDIGSFLSIILWARRVIELD
jgi:hypothetical protein